MMIALTANAADTIVPNLKAIGEGRDSRLVRVRAEWFSDDGGKSGLTLSTVPAVDGFVMISGVLFTNGVIEFDAKAK